MIFILDNKYPQFRIEILDAEKRISDIISENKDNQNLITIYFVKEIHEFLNQQVNQQITSQRRLIIIMENCESNLQNLLFEKKIFNDEEILDFLNQFLQGYKVLYNKFIIHRNIKPENILVNKVNGKIIYKQLTLELQKYAKLMIIIFLKLEPSLCCSRDK
ncbi:unnamed protein product [Paramecium sonneborni]|uniref:Protein kinase domain-containing protein n=1 Tax=Paramecium sonneborni TaxID=65129 RepID=A0A8S1LUB1_9CILI|nr:unnamed protein product [Paramecium sonneborni]CAD8069609.1 unnamed protein product [Paramecium sonneborni]